MVDPTPLDQLATEAWSSVLDQGVVNAACWSPDGALLVLDCYRDFLVILDGKSGEEVKRLTRLDYSRSHAFWSNDGKLLFSHVLDDIRVWEVETWREIRRFPVSSRTDSFAVDPTGSMVATAYDVGSGYHGFGRVDVWRTEDGSKAASIETKASVLGVSLSPSGRVATWTNGGTVKIWDVDANTVVGVLEIAKGTSTRAIWSPSEASIVVASNGGEINVFDARSGERRFCRDTHGTAMFNIHAMGFSSDESWFVSKGGDGKVLLWRTTGWLPIGVFEPITNNWRAKGPPVLAVKPNEPVLLTQNEDCNGVTVWHLGDRALAVLSGREPATVHAAPRRAATMSASPSESRLYAASLISLAELQRLGELTRWQDVRKRLRTAERESGPLRSYPLFRGWSEPDADVDVFDGSRWKRVRFRSRDDRRITYEHEGDVRQIEFHRDAVAPAGHFTDFHEPEVAISSAELSTGTSLRGDGWLVDSSRLVGVEWPYLTLYVKQSPTDAHGRTSSEGSYTFHVADPRLIVEGVKRPQPHFNAPIAVSHRWRDVDHPDRSGNQYRELLDRAAAMKLHPMQPFLIDYCSLPQKPWTPEEQQIFTNSLLPFQASFSNSSIIIEHGAEDYDKRAWCMLELILIAINGRLADGPEKLSKPPELPFGLTRTWEQAENFLKLANGSVMNFGRVWKASPRNPWMAYYADTRSMQFLNAREKQRRKLLQLFDTELEVTDPSDRPRIKKILMELVFRKGPI